MFGIELAVFAHPASVHLLAERLAAAYPPPQSGKCSVWLQVGEVEHCKLLFAVTSYFHFFQKLKSKILFFENHPVPPYPEGGLHRSPQAPLSSGERGCKPLLLVALNRCALR